jgi:hypothetical protein
MLRLFLYKTGIKARSFSIVKIDAWSKGINFVKKNPYPYKILKNYCYTISKGKEF